MHETTSVIALGSVTEERDGVNSRRFRAALRPSVCWPGSKRSRIFWRKRPPICAASATSAMRTGAVAAGGRRGARWPFDGGRVAIERVRTPDGQRELELPSLAAGQRENWQWAMNQMLINVSTRRFRRSVRLPDGDVVSIKGDGTSKS